MKQPTCLYCQKILHFQRSDAKYCGPLCRQKAYLKRKKKPTEENPAIPAETITTVNHEENHVEKQITKNTSIDKISSGVQQSTVNNELANMILSLKQAALKREASNGDPKDIKTNTVEQLQKEKEEKVHAIAEQTESIKNVNRQIKQWIQELLDLTAKPVFFCHQLTKILRTINHFQKWNEDYRQLPEDYPHFDTIEQLLKAPIEEVVEQMKEKRQALISGINQNDAMAKIWQQLLLRLDE